jgi:isopentenyldiphosphate isomerase
MSGADESVVIVDERNLVETAMAATCGQKTHSYILVFNSANQLFMHKRSTSKDIYPGVLRSGG